MVDIKGLYKEDIPEEVSLHTEPFAVAVEVQLVVERGVQYP